MVRILRALAVFFITVFLLIACQESLEQRAMREAKEFTLRNCPVRIDQGTVLDSLVFNNETLTMHYYYTLDNGIDKAVLSAKARQLLLQQLRNSTSTKTFKDAGYSFSYTYFSSQQPQEVLFQTVLTAKDYR